MPKTVALIGKHQAVGIEHSLQILAEFLLARGHAVILETETAKLVAIQGASSMNVEALGQSAEVAIVLGGDGTVLGIARTLAPFGIPLIGINLGRLGFMTDIPVETMVPLIGEMLDGRAEIEKRTLLQGTVYRGNAKLISGLAFNDVVVSRSAGAGMVELRVEVDGHFMYNQRSDGLIIATPTGSTAYALSAGGPVLHPSLSGIVLTPIAPHSLSNRPIVIPDSSQLVVEIKGDREVSINFDMQSFVNLLPQDRVVIARSIDTVSFMHPEGWSYYDTLRKKLRWNEGPTVSDGLLNRPK